MNKRWIGVPFAAIGMVFLMGATVLNSPIQCAGTQCAASDLSNGVTGSGAVVLAAGGALTGITGLGIRDTSAAFDLTIAATSSTALSAGRILTLDMKNVAHTLAFGSTANTITFPSLASYTLITNGDTGTVTNTMLVSPSTTVNGQTCTLGSTCTVTAVSITLTAKTTGYSVLSGDAGTYFSNSGAGGSVIFTLPASPATAQQNCYIVAAAQILEILAPASTKIAIGNTNSATAGNIQSNTVNNTVCILALTATQWVSIGPSAGTWTVN